MPNVPEGKGEPGVRPSLLLPTWIQGRSMWNSGIWHWWRKEMVLSRLDAALLFIGVCIIHLKGVQIRRRSRVVNATYIMSSSASYTNCSKTAFSAACALSCSIEKRWTYSAIVIERRFVRLGGKQIGCSFARILGTLYWPGVGSFFVFLPEFTITNKNVFNT